MSDIYNLLIPEERTNENGEVTKTFWHRVGSAFPHKKGDGFTLVVPEGISLSGRVMMLPRKGKDEAPDDTAQSEFNESAPQG